MARKKKRSGHKSGQRAGARAATQQASEPSSRDRVGDSDAANRKAARKEEARRQREAVRKQMARRKRMRQGGIVAAVLAVIGVIVFVSTTGGGSPTPTGEISKLLSQASGAMKTAGCTGVKTVPPYNPSSSDRNHIGSNGQAQPPLSSYPSIPPASGPHDPSPLGAGVYTSPPSVFQAIHSLEHGAVEIWYPPSASGSSQLKQITDFFKANQDHVIVAEYNYPSESSAGQLPSGTQMALVAWHRLQTCKQLSLPVAANFAAHYRFPTLGGQSYQGEAPEKGAAI